MVKILEAQRAKNRERILLELHRHGPFQRIALSERLELRTNSVGSICAEMLEWGLISEANLHPLNQLQLNPNGPFFASLYIGVNCIECSRVFLDGRLEAIFSEPYPNKTPPEKILKHLRDKLSKSFAGNPLLCGIGISLPGLVDAKRGTVSHAVNLPGWHNIEVAEIFRKDFSRLTMVENEARCHLWDEIWFKRREALYSTIVYLLLIEGVACAVLAEGKLLQGFRSAAGEIGHIPCGENRGISCVCGKTDCLEVYCSEPALLKQARSLSGDCEKGKFLADYLSIMRHDAKLTRMIDNAARRLADCLYPVVATLDPSEIILGCRDIEISKILSDPLRFHLREKLMGLPSFDVDIIPSQASEKTVIRGMGGLLMQEYFKRIGTFSPLKKNKLPVMTDNMK